MHHRAARPPFCLLIASASLLPSLVAQQLVTGPSSSRPPYLVPIAPAGVVVSVTAIATATDLVPRHGGPPGAAYEIGGTPDGTGAFANGDGTFTILCNHEHASTQGIVRAHGAAGSYVSELVVDASTLAVVRGRDAIVRVVDEQGLVHDAATGNGLALHRFCSADLAPASAFFDPATGLGTQDRLFLTGEEGSGNGYSTALAATGPQQGTQWILRALQLATNGSGLPHTASHENLLACPFAQPTTLVIGNNDGGTGLMDRTLSVYVGTKTATGTPVERAGLHNGTLSFVLVPGIPHEIADPATRATAIASGMRFALTSGQGTVFSRPEDGAWDPVDPRSYWFATTDQIDTVTTTGSNPTIGALGPFAIVGRSRLWRLRFDDLANPHLGGVIDLVIDGEVQGTKVQCLDNLTIDARGRLFLQEDPGATWYAPKVWMFDPATGLLAPLLKFDPARWGELPVNGGTPGALPPHTDDKESSGILDVTHLVPVQPGETALLVCVQDHSSDPLVATAGSVAGGQLLLVRVRVDAEATAYGTGCGAPPLALQPAPGSLPVLGATAVSLVQGRPAGRSAVMAIGFSDVQANGLALPLPLDTLGMPGCSLYHDVAYTSFSLCATTGPGTAQYALGLPREAAFAGFAVFLQVWAHDDLANPFGLVLSNGLRYRLGF